MNYYYYKSLALPSTTTIPIIINIHFFSKCISIMLLLPLKLPSREQVLIRMLILPRQIIDSI